MPVKAAGDFNTGLIKFTGNDFGTADPAMLKNCSRLVSLNIDESAAVHLCFFYSSVRPCFVMKYMPCQTGKIFCFS